MNGIESGRTGSRSLSPRRGLGVLTQDDKSGMYQGTATQRLVHLSYTMILRCCARGLLGQVPNSFSISSAALGQKDRGCWKDRHLFASTRIERSSISTPTDRRTGAPPRRLQGAPTLPLRLQVPCPWRYPGRRPSQSPPARPPARR